MEAPRVGVSRMKITSVVGAAVAAVIVAAGVAVAGNFASSHHEDYFAAGTHQFYVWCAKGDDYTATQFGSSAPDAQMRLYEKAKNQGHNTCWPLWQGRISG